MASSESSSRRRQYRFHGAPSRRQGVVRLALQLAAARRRLAVASGGASRRQGVATGVRNRRQRQQNRLLLTLVEPFPGEWRRHIPGERFWWSVRWFGAGVLTAIAASRLS